MITHSYLFSQDDAAAGSMYRTGAAYRTRAAKATARAEAASYWPLASALLIFHGRNQLDMTNIAWSTVQGPLASYPPGFNIAELNALLAFNTRMTADIGAMRRELIQLRESLAAVETDNLNLRRNKRGRTSFQASDLTQVDRSIRDALWDFVEANVWPHNKELSADDFKYTPDERGSLCQMILQTLGDHLPAGNREHYYSVRIAAMVNTKMVNLRGNAPKKLVVVHKCEQLK